MPDLGQGRISPLLSASLRLSLASAPSTTSTDLKIVVNNQALIHPQSEDRAGDEQSSGAGARASTREL